METLANKEEYEHFEDTHLANEVVKGAFHYGKTIKGLIQSYVDISYENSHLQLPKEEDIYKTIDRCVKLGILIENGRFISPTDNSLFRTLKHRLEKNITVYKFGEDVFKNPSLCKKILKKVPKGFGQRSVYSPNGRKEFWVRTERELPHSILKELKPKSQSIMTEEQFFEEAYEMHPLLQEALMTARKK